ncbi:PIN domain-containing protein [Aeromonas veronii]|uniref:PIN domain-containing protein n=1 Tax=Aeromonas veronii TaxID=654 RepID=UPI002A6A44C2|nr:PIN domain-containing protein [Aeromonas veronii]
MNVFLDTNVVLTGALNPYGPASRLSKLLGEVIFYTSQRVIQECTWLLNKKTKDEQKINLAGYLINSYLKSLNTILVPDEEVSHTVVCYDVDDQYIYDAARKHNCEYICTYNVRDFPASQIKARTPHYILLEQEQNNIENYIQLPLLNKHGTMIFIGSLAHKSSMGKILQSDSGINVFTNNNGDICIEGKSVKNIFKSSSLEGNIEQVLSFRYNSDNFEAARWSLRDGNWDKQVLTRANCSFSENTKPLLFFCKDHNFNGHVKNVSGIPRYVKDKHMQHVLSNKSLETVAGSLDLKYVLDNTKIMTTPNGLKIEYPVKNC